MFVAVVRHCGWWDGFGGKRRGICTWGAYMLLHSKRDDRNWCLERPQLIGAVQRQRSEERHSGAWVGSVWGDKKKGLNLIKA